MGRGGLQRRTIVGAKEVEDGEDLAVVRDQRLANHVGRLHQLLQHFQHRAHDLGRARVQCSCSEHSHHSSSEMSEMSRQQCVNAVEVGRTLDWDDKLRDDGQNAWAAFCQQVLGAFEGQEFVRLLLLTQAVKKDGQVVMIIQFFNIYFPSNLNKQI